MDDPSAGGLSVRERRRPRERRRGTGISFWTKDVSGGLCWHLAQGLVATSVLNSNSPTRGRGAEGQESLREREAEEELVRESLGVLGHSVLPGTQ